MKYQTIVHNNPFHNLLILRAEDKETEPNEQFYFPQLI